jgi:hypothetical protein
VALSSSSIERRSSARLCADRQAQDLIAGLFLSASMAGAATASAGLTGAGVLARPSPDPNSGAACFHQQGTGHCQRNQAGAVLSLSARLVSAVVAE